MLGAKVHPVTTGNMTLSDACSEAIRDWCCHPSDTFYIVGSTMGPHLYPDIVARMQSIISEEIKWQLQEKEGRDRPDCLVACIGGGSNAAGTVYHYVDDSRVRIILAEDPPRRVAAASVRDARLRRYTVVSRAYCTAAGCS